MFLGFAPIDSIDRRLVDVSAVAPAIKSGIIARRYGSDATKTTGTLGCCAVNSAIFRGLSPEATRLLRPDHHFAVEPLASPAGDVSTESSCLGEKVAEYGFTLSVLWMKP